MKKGITTSFNIIATLALFIAFTVQYASVRELNIGEGSNTIVDVLFESSEIKVLFYLFVFIIVAATLSAVFKEIWNRLLSDILTLREITFNEAYSLCFLLMAVTLY
ncbi:hypothetical protein [Paraglaciecola polaris]|uniref:Uncharacterized protein n=1 Tax=Paraglaciecola polaris LMG 21857 TaxID=1129793 RepID=K6YK02_9ALTE|nr:hypothetical protein [Paraglaciecola polaris]GAC33044.1 hypothetical protein GPLA_2139 [Paraglaciecola polaris LMG 21857]